MMKKHTKNTGLPSPKMWEIGHCDKHLAPTELMFAIGKHRLEGIIRRVNASSVDVAPVECCDIKGSQSDACHRFILPNSLMDNWDMEDFENHAVPTIVLMVNFLRFHTICADALKWEPNLYVRVHTGCGVWSEVAVPIEKYFEKALRFAHCLLGKAYVASSPEDIEKIKQIFLVDRRKIYVNFNKMVLKIKEKERD
jgi:hypothetical protein